MTTRKATRQDVKVHYNDQGYECRISKDGHVTYRMDIDKPWREGRYVTEYVKDDRDNVHLT